MASASQADGPRPSVVVTGGSGGVGRALVERLRRDAHVVVLDPVTADLPSDVALVTGDAADPATARRAAAVAEERGPLTGWVNNAAVFRDARLDTADAGEVLDLVTTNLALAVVGCHTAVRHLLEHDRAGSIVTVSSHQAARPVRGALPYATAKAAVEGLTRAVAVDHGPQSIRANAVALGSVDTARYRDLVAARPEVPAQLAALHPLGRVASAAEVADVVAFLLSPAASFVSGVVLPVDGGRSVLGPDPEAVGP